MNKEEIKLNAHSDEATVLPDKWNKKYDKCKECGTIKKKHRAKGLCVTCYFKKYRAEHPELINKARNKWARNNKHKLKIYAKEYRQRASKKVSQ